MSSWARTPPSDSGHRPPQQFLSTGCTDVDLTTSHGVRELRGLDEADDDPVQIRVVLPPVAWVADDGQLPAALPALDEERAAPDRDARLRVVDARLPDVSSSAPTSAWRGRMTVKSRARQSAKSSPRNATLTVFASTARTLRIFLSTSSGKPGGAIWKVKTKSAAVTGVPSLQRAAGRTWYVSVNGFLATVTCETRCGREM